MITMEDREKYPYCTDSSILGMKLVSGLKNEVLLGIKEHGPKAEGYRAVLTLVGKETNPHWILGRIAEEMYARDLITHPQFDAFWERYS